MDNKALNDALTVGVKEALGSLQFLVISLQAENAVLRARVAELEKAAALPPERISTHAAEEAINSLAGIV